MREGTIDHPYWRFAAAGGKGRGRRGRPSPEEIERIVELRQMRGGGPFGGGRGRRRRGDVRTAVLLLLAEGPRNGYQLMQEIEERSRGHWRPSPGSMYPTLSQLEDEGLIHATEIDGAKAFEITDAGRGQLVERGDSPAPWDHEDEDGPSPRQVRHEIGAVAAAAWQVAQAGNEEQIKKAREVLEEARRRLYRILAGDDE